MESSFYVAIKELFVMNLNERQGTDVETIGRCGFSDESIELSKIKKYDDLFGRQTGCRNAVLKSNSFLDGYHIVNLLARHLVRLTRGTVIAVIDSPTTKVDRLVKLFRDMDE